MKEIYENFEILKQLGSGGFSRVYKVESKQNHQIYALKILDAEDTDLYSDTRNDYGEIIRVLNPASKEYKEFVNEVEVLKKLNSDNILKVYDYMILDGKPCILMEYLDGDTLENILNDKKILDKDEVLGITLQISAALYHCHNMQFKNDQLGYKSETQIIVENAIIHNDIHPKNIMKIEQGNGKYRYVLIDFGLSFSNPKNITDDLKKNGMAEYKSPEKWKNEVFSTYTDIYSLGILLYQCLAGTVPFPLENSDSDAEMKHLEYQHCNATPPDIWQLRKENLQNIRFSVVEKPDFPYWLKLLIDKCLEKDPLQRFRTGKELNQYYHLGMRGELPTDWPTHTIPKPQPIPQPIPQPQPKPQPRPQPQPQPIPQPQSQPLLSYLGYLVFFVAIAFGTWYGMDYLKNRKSNVNTDSANKEIVNNFLEKDIQATSQEDIKDIVAYLGFPLNYYGRNLSSETEFVQFYSQAIEKEKKHFVLDSLVEDKDTPNFVKAYLKKGKDSIYTNRLGNRISLKKSSITDNFHIENGKITSISRIKNNN